MWDDVMDAVWMAAIAATIQAFFQGAQFLSDHKRRRTDKSQIILAKPSRQLFSIGVACLIFTALAYDLFDRYGFSWSNITGHPNQYYHDQTFSDKVVDLDGNSYSHCVFSNVTFQWSGGPFEFSNNVVYGAKFSSNNDYINRAFYFMTKLGLLKIPEYDPDGNPIAPGVIWKKGQQ